MHESAVLSDLQIRLQMKGNSHPELRWWWFSSSPPRRSWRSASRHPGASGCRVWWPETSWWRSSPPWPREAALLRHGSRWSLAPAGQTRRRWCGSLRRRGPPSSPSPRRPGPPQGRLGGRWIVCAKLVKYYLYLNITGMKLSVGGENSVGTDSRG